MIIQNFFVYGNSVNIGPTSFPDLFSKTTGEIMTTITTQQHQMTLKLIFSIKLVDTFLPVSPSFSKTKGPNILQLHEQKTSHSSDLEYFLLCT